MARGFHPPPSASLNVAHCLQQVTTKRGTIARGTDCKLNGLPRLPALTSTGANVQKAGLLRGEVLNVRPHYFGCRQTQVTSERRQTRSQRERRRALGRRRSHYSIRTLLPFRSMKFFRAYSYYNRTGGSFWSSFFAFVQVFFELTLGRLSAGKIANRSFSQARGPRTHKPTGPRCAMGMTPSTND